jgi:hypothetical protein
MLGSSSASKKSKKPALQKPEPENPLSNPTQALPQAHTQPQTCTSLLEPEIILRKKQEPATAQPTIQTQQSHQNTLRHQDQPSHAEYTEHAQQPQKNQKTQKRLAQDDPHYITHIADKDHTHNLYQRDLHSITMIQCNLLFNTAFAFIKPEQPISFFNIQPKFSLYMQDCHINSHLYLAAPKQSVIEDACFWINDDDSAMPQGNSQELHSHPPFIQIPNSPSAAPPENPPGSQQIQNQIVKEEKYFHFRKPYFGFLYDYEFFYMHYGRQEFENIDF